MITYPQITNEVAGEKEGVMVFNATFNNISITSWLSVLLAEETGVLLKRCH
jgi:hypothetical protein